MAFELIMPQVTTLKSGPEEVSLALYGKDETYSISIKLGQKVMQTLGWEHGARVVIGEGTGTDAGFLELRRVARGGYGIAVHNFVKGREQSEFDGVVKCLARKFTHYETPMEPRSQQAVPYEVIDGALRMVVPDWMTPASKKDVPAYAKNRAGGLGGVVPAQNSTPPPRPRPRKSGGDTLTIDELIT